MSKLAEPSDDFMELLTDALRAGPGSPEWHQAVIELRKQGGDTAADDYKLLYTARERLASGKQYRSIKAGPGFTRRLLDGIEHLPVPGTKARPAPVATIIALASVLVLLGVIAVVAYWTWNAPTAPGPENLSTLVFTQTTLEEDFGGPLDAARWRTLGSLPLIVDHGLRPAPATSADFTGGAILTTSPVASPGQSLSITLTLTGTPADHSLPQLFVTDRPNEISADRGTTPHELVWTVQDKQSQLILPDGHLAPARTAVPLMAAATTVRLIVGPTTVSVTTNNEPLYTGPHQLPSDHPRYLGVRFLSKSGPPSDVVVTSVRVEKP